MSDLITIPFRYDLFKKDWRKTPKSCSPSTLLVCSGQPAGTQKDWPPFHLFVILLLNLSETVISKLRLINARAQFAKMTDAVIVFF